MAHRRSILPRQRLEGDALTSAMAGIGMNVAAEPNPEVVIEDVLDAVAQEAMERDDLRSFDLLVGWLEVHLARVNADRIVRMVQESSSERVTALWSSIAIAHPGDRRFARLVALSPPERIGLLDAGAAFQIARHGEDPLFDAGPLRVPGNLLRRRPADVLKPADLAKLHRGYYYRVLIGPSYRADMWAVLERSPRISATELARTTYGSFATAWSTLRDFELLTGVPRIDRRLPGIQVA